MYRLRRDPSLAVGLYGLLVMMMIKLYIMYIDWLKVRQGLHLHQRVNLSGILPQKVVVEAVCLKYTIS